MSGSPAARPSRQASSGLSLVEVCDVAREAYTYGYPLVDGYRQLHVWFIDRDHHDYKGAWNRIHPLPPEPDTADGVLGLDLRREPLVLTVPRIDADRYFVIQGNDLYSHIFGHIGTRTTGNEPGHFLIAGPNWHSKPPRTVTAVLPCETELALMTLRLQCHGRADRAKAGAQLAAFEITPLSRFMGLPPPDAPPAGIFITPLSLRAERNSLSFFSELNFILSLCVPHDSERDLMNRFARLDIGRHLTFDAAEFSSEARLAIDDGMADAWQEMEAARRRRTDEARRLHGSRAQMKGNYLNRVLGAIDGLWALAAEERMIHAYSMDIEHQRLDGTYHHYALRMSGHDLPPVTGFWSLSLSHMPTGVPVAAPPDRHMVSSARISALMRESDGGLTLYIQREPVTGPWEPNWLPAPPGPFRLCLNLYGPKAEALSGVWTPPPIYKTH